jgi:hypothetical protein
LKYESILCPDGIIVNLKGAYQGRRHDAGIFRESQLYNELERAVVFPDNERYLLYGDRLIHLCLYRDIFLTLNIAHTYSLCSVLKNTGQCMYVIT